MSRKVIRRLDPHSGAQRVEARLLRIDRSLPLTGTGPKVGRRGSEKPELERFSVENPKKFIGAVIYSPDGLLSHSHREALYVARVLAGLGEDTAVLAIVFGKLESDLSQFGADLSLVMDSDPGAFRPRQDLELLEKTLEDYDCEHLLFSESEWGESCLARSLAVRRGMSFADRVIEIGDDWLRRSCDNGWQQAKGPLTRIMIIEPGTADADFDFVTEHRRLDLTQPGKAIPAPLQERFALPAEQVPLAESPFIVAAGNGVADMKLFFRMARALGASIAGSRVVVDDGKLPRDLQVGATGTKVAAKVYIAIGISGAIQHLQGIEDCEYVIAVNKDPNCDMVKRANLSVICDAGEWMEAMLKLHEKQPEKLVS